MAFFSKLKERLFKSSSKIDEGLDAIVEAGGVEENAPLEASQDPPVPPPDVSPKLPDEIQPLPTEIEPLPDETSPLPDEIAPTPDEIAPLPDRDPPVPDPAPEELPPAPNEVPDLPDETPEMPEEAPEPPIEEPPYQPVEVPDTPYDDPSPDTETLTAARPAEPPPETSQPTRPGILGRLFNRPEQKVVVRRALDDDMLEQIEELLISADMGVETSMRVAANMAEGRLGKKFSTEELKDVMASEIARIMDPVAKPMPIYQKRPQVVLVVGVNGSGKTTTIGKLASQFRAAGKTVVIAAGDTFRAAAVEQLQVWGERAGVPVMTAPEGSDPASLAYDAMTKAEADGADLLMIDTAGRLQYRQDLMEELAKIVRVIRKKDPDAPHNTLLVLDATTGQNALNQVEIFQKIADVSGLVMTKLDGTAKGGVLVALADRFGLPIHAIGVGEQIDDLAPFDPREFAAALTGLEE